MSIAASVDMKCFSSTDLTRTSPQVALRCGFPLTYKDSQDIHICTYSAAAIVLPDKSEVSTNFCVHTLSNCILHVLSLTTLLSAPLCFHGNSRYEQRAVSLMALFACQHRNVQLAAETLKNQGVGCSSELKPL